MTKQFTQDDVANPDSKYPRIYCTSADLIDAPTKWQAMGLQETATGYGRRLNTGLKIDYCGRKYRLYATCFSNCASVWFAVRGRKIYVD